MKPSIWRINLIANFTGGFLALWKIALNPSEEQAAIFLGYSLARMLVILLIISILAADLFIYVKSFQSAFWVNKVGRLINNVYSNIALYLGLIFLGLSYVILFASDQLLGNLAPYRAQLFPVILWLLLTSLQILFTIVILKKHKLITFHKYKYIIFSAFMLWIVFLLVMIVIAFTRVGLEPDKAYWQDPGAPLLMWQVLLAWGIGSAFYHLSQSYNDFKWSRKLKYLRPLTIDHYLCLTIWLIAFALWTAIPDTTSYFSLTPRAPNFESYPFADAIIYDSNAQNFLMGNPIPSDFWQKPFYAFFLSLLHLLAGQNYELIIILQVGILAFIPVTVFLLTQILSNRSAGVIAATLVIFREINALSLSNVIQISHTRMLMSDVFALGLIAILILLLIIWLSKPNKHRILPMFVGGILGVLTLTRGHALLILPFIVLASAIVLIPAAHTRRFIMGTIVLLIGLSIPLGVWLWRNYQWTGNLSMQDPVSPYTTQIARLYSLTPLNDPFRFQAENDLAYYTRIQKQPVSFIIEHPEEVVRFISAHFAHNMIFSFIYLPISLDIESATEYVKRMPFWKNWTGQLPAGAMVFLGINFFIIALGFRGSYKRGKNLVFIPLLLGIGYILSVSMGRLSGWRLILPVDWITLIFYSIGLVQLIAIVHSLFSDNKGSVTYKINASPENATVSPWNWFAFVGIAIVFLGLGLGLTFGHKLFSLDYPKISSGEIVQKYQEHATGLQGAIPIDALINFLKKDQAVALYGRGLYPSYMPKNDGELNYIYLAFARRPYKRLSFQLIGPEEVGVVLPLSSRPKIFPNAANVIVFGCYIENKYVSSLPGYVDALAVVVETDPPIIYVRDSEQDLQCSL